MMAVRFAKGVQQLLVPIEQVRQHPRNANNADMDKLIESIQINGFVTAVTVDANTGYIVAGNHRYQALLALGSTHIPVLWVDHWDENGSARYMVADNKTADLAEMDKGLLIELLNDLADSERGLVGSGFDDDSYQRLLEEFAMPEEIPEEPGFGAGEAVLGIFEVVVSFDNADDRDEAFASLSDYYDHDKVRTVNL